MGKTAGKAPAGQQDSAQRSYFLGIARGFGAALIFAMPMLMTMEYWWLGFYVSRVRLAVFVLLMFALLIVLGFFVGLRPTTSLVAETLDAATGYSIGLIAALAALAVMGLITLEMPPHEIIGKVLILSAVTGFGAMLGRSQLGNSTGGDKPQQRRRSRSAAEKCRSLGCFAMI